MNVYTVEVFINNINFNFKKEKNGKKKYFFQFYCANNISSTDVSTMFINRNTMYKM